MRRLETPSEILAERQNREGIYKQMHLQMKDALNMYNGDFHVLNDEARNSGKFHEVLTITSRQLVDNIAAQLVPQKFSVHFNPLKETVKEREHAELLEDIATNMLSRWGVTKSFNPFVEAGRNVGMYGLSALRLLWDNAAWGKKPVRQQYASGEEFEYREALWEAERMTRLPFVLKAIDPLNMLPWPGDEPRDMMEFYSVKPFMLEDSFPQIAELGEKPYNDVELTTYWSPTTFQYVVGKQSEKNLNGPIPLRTLPVNPYFGMIPYTMIWSGLGKTSPYGKPEQKAVGLIWPLIPLLKEESRMLTAVSIIVQATAIPRSWKRGTDAENIEVGIGPGESTSLESDQEIGYWPMPQASSDLYSIMKIAGDQVERYVGYKLLGGERPAGVTSAMFEEILLEQGKRRYNTLIQSMEAAYQGTVSQALFLLEHVIKEKIPGTKIKPEQIRGYYKSEVTFNYGDVAERRIKAMMARMLFMSGLIDFQTAHNPDYLNTENVEEVRQGLIEDKLYQNPELIAALAIKQAEKLGIGEIMNRVQARNRQQATGSNGSSELAPNETEEYMLNQLLNTPSGGIIRPPGNSGGGMGGGEGEPME